MTDPRPAASPTTRRAARADALLDVTASPVRHARARRASRIAAGFAAFVALTLVVGTGAAVAAALTGPALAADVRLGDEAGDEPLPLPEVVQAIPVPSMTGEAATGDICALDGVADALAAGDDVAAIERAGGGEAFRAAVVSGGAACIRLDDAARLWVVVNKHRPYDPIDYRPASLALPGDVRSLEGGALRADAAAALDAMVAEARVDGVGEIALQSGFRSYQTQQGSYGRQVSARGVDGADLVSARPGYSEHQSGLAADVVACDGWCGTIDDLAATAQGDWIVDNAWRYGWIVRYEQGRTDVTGYVPEPWHLRYVGPQLAQAYHDGGWTTLEEFFGLPAAPHYDG
ncbi:M15 family metallopeptidase [Microbacterium thalassium]|uniref:D-alanyl-D-alanine carboxypeptidase n=1 Tax=Microbacterium thalassium TaxID=362649 RepID=A0A7X0KTG7_9MICO|nr:M15 family metallopeptidase [Microbacterium thalassium]MBB6390079.1 D-alanyl-D-alanine carboxypeptidase [Microbacterium thalassium]GLK25187.1 hypothetical protein GCM10017607_25060 [Microbacterium thalassium]